MPLAALALGTGLVAGMSEGAAATPGLRADTASLAVRVESGKPYLVDAGGKPFLVHGDTAWSLIGDLTREDALVYLDDRHRRGFNALVVSLLEYHYSRNAPRNAYGHHPFARSGTMTAPADDYFRHADWVIEQAEKRGMLLFLAPAYIGYSGGNDGWYRTMASTGAQALREYGRFLGRRYGSRRNIIWMHGGDANPPDRTLCAAVAEGIRSEAPGSLHTAHCGPETMAVEYWGDQSWLGLNTLYTYKPVHLQAARALAVRARLPTVLIESAYEDETGTGSPAADAYRVRAQAYQAILGGACGHVFGNNPIWHFAGPGMSPAPADWKSALAGPGSRSMEHFWLIVSGLPWWTLEPNVQLIVSGAGAEADRAVAGTSGDRTLAVVYGPSRREVMLDVGELSGPALLIRWFDPATGERTKVDVVKRGADRHLALIAPAIAGRQPRDWLLVLNRTNDGRIP